MTDGQINSNDFPHRKVTEEAILLLALENGGSLRLQRLRDRNTGSNIYSILSGRLGLSNDALTRRTEGDLRPAWMQEVRRCRQILVAEKLLEERKRSGTGIWKLTEAGWIKARDLERTSRLLGAEEADQGYNPSGMDARRFVERQIRERRGQRLFRNALREKYGNRCLVTKCGVLAVLEAAHINPYRGENDNHPENGLLLRADVHTLFDLDLLGIEPTNLRVELHPEVIEAYGNLAGIELACPSSNRPSQEALATRYDEFRKRLPPPP